MSQDNTEKKSGKKEYLKGWVSYAVKRYWVYVGITIAALAMPFVKINGNHIFLLSFDHKELQLAGQVFPMQDLLPLLFLLIILFIGIFAMTAIGGRVWCGWACPQTVFRVIYRDLIETKILKLRKRIKNKQQEPDMSKPANQIKKAVAVAIWTILAFIAAADFVWYFVPPEDFFNYLQSPADHPVMMGLLTGVALFLIADIVFIKENFCVYICPYSRVQSVLYDDDTIMAVYDPIRGGGIYEGEGDNRHKVYSKKKDLLAVEPNAECVACESCVTVCPTHIDIRKGLQLECINCLECADACTTVQAAFDRPSLIQWTSEREGLHHNGKTSFTRPKAIAYLGVLAIAIVGLIMVASGQENMGLTINKSHRLYKTLPGKIVENDYKFLFANTDKKDHEYYFDVVGADGKVTIKKPKDHIMVSAGSKAKQVVILRTADVLAKDAKMDVSIPITIKAYAVDDPKNINVDVNNVFIYPRVDELKE